jgi:hypothetical protein
MRVCSLAASGRTGASGATQRGFRPRCGAAESGFIMIGPPGDDASAARS